MKIKIAFVAAALVFTTALAGAQQTTQPEMKVDSSNRTLSVSATETVNVEPDLAILHIGFDTAPGDAKAAYADGSRASNAIIAAVKQAGIAESAIRSESQYLDRDYSTKQHKFVLHQQWTVKVPPERAAEILDVAVTAGATDSGQIDWTVKDVPALESQALDHAAARARQNGEILAKGMGVRLGSLIYVSNQMSAPQLPRPIFGFAIKAAAPNVAPPLSIEPHQVSREAVVYAVFAIE
jgi:hypothetical protein